MKSPVIRALVLAALLIVAWVLWSGYPKPLLLALGALSCLLTLWVVRRMGYFHDETFAFNYGWRLFRFWAWLGREVILSSLEVARVVLSRRIEVKPQIVKVDGRAFSSVDLALLGNSITLTPGTLTLDVHEGHLLVHALTKNGAEALQAGEMQSRVAALRKS